MPLLAIQSTMARLTNAGPLSERRNSDAPCPRASLGQNFDDTPGADRAGHIDCQALAGQLPDRRQVLDLLASGGGVEDEVVSPQQVRVGRRHWTRRARGDAPPGAPARLRFIEFYTRAQIDDPATRRNFEIRASNDPNFQTYSVLHSQGASPLAHEAVLTREISDPTRWRYVRATKTVSEFFFITELVVRGEP